MLKKIFSFVAMGVFGIAMLPSVVSAARTDQPFTVNIDYKGVDSNKFVVEYCNEFDSENGSCTAWNNASSKSAIELNLNNWDGPENSSWVNYLRLSKDTSVEGYASTNYTVIYNSAISESTVLGKPINNFLGDDTTTDDTNFMVFEFDSAEVTNNTYTISVYPTLKSFGWNFEDVNEEGINDSGITNGTAELKTNTSDTGNVLIKIKEGDYQILPGTDVTIQLLPNEGYQLTSLSIGADDAPLTAGDKVGYYTFKMPNHNLHFKSIFSSVEDIIKNKSLNVSNGTVVGSDGLINNGNLRLSIEDISDADIKKGLNENVESGNVAAYLDLNLDNVLFKGTEEDVWSESLTDLGNKYVTITLELGSIELTEDSYIVYEHDEKIYTIEAKDIIYDEEENTITFNANKFSNYAVVTSAEKNNHIIKNGKNDEFIMSFEDIIKDDYELEINSLLDLLKLTDEELEEAEIDATHEEIETIINGIKDGTSKTGNLVGLYEISVVLNGNKKTDGPFVFKVKLTDELKKFNTYNMIYIDDEFKVTTTVVSGTVKDDYIIFTLPHLSIYGLVASNVENPKTNDGVMNSIILGSISLFGLLSVGLYTKKKIFN